MNLKNRLENYARLIVREGVNVQEGQPVIIKCSVENYDFCRMLVHEAYLAKASFVHVDYLDNVNSKNHYIYQSIEELKNIPEYVIDREKYFIDKKSCKISIVSSDPAAFASVDPIKLNESAKALNEKLRFARDYTMGNHGQWCVAAAASIPWAIKVFPNCSEDEALTKLWNAILDASRVGENNQQWINHSNTIADNCEKLNSLNLRSLHFKNSLGTDINIELATDNCFGGGADYRVSDNVKFSPNIPTEEIFGMPHKDKVNGVVCSTKPLIYQGNIIDNFKLTFKDGEVIEYDAKVGKESLKSLIEFDNGSRRLGEVALVPFDSPISNMNILFYNTLFDENASCHLALGNAYSMNIVNGTSMSKSELEKRGANTSNTHVDFMFGSKDMNVTGIDKDGKTIEIFKNGNFVI